MRHSTPSRIRNRLIPTTRWPLPVLPAHPPVPRPAPEAGPSLPECARSDSVTPPYASVPSALAAHQNQPQSLHRLHPIRNGIADPEAASLLSGSGNAIRPAASRQRFHAACLLQPTPRIPKGISHTRGPPPCGWESSPPPSRPPPATLPPPRSGSSAAGTCTAYAMRLRVCQGKSCVPRAGCSRVAANEYALPEGTACPKGRQPVPRVYLAFAPRSPVGATRRMGRPQGEQVQTRVSGTGGSGTNLRGRVSAEAAVLEDCFAALRRVWSRGPQVWAPGPRRPVSPSRHCP